MDIDFMKFQKLFSILWKMKTVERWHGRYWDEYNLKRYESVSDHIWRMLMILVYLEGKLSFRYDILHTIKIILVHDLPEIITWDESAANPTSKYNNPASKKDKEEAERLAIHEIFREFDDSFSKESIVLWEEYEAGVSNEAKVAKCIDKLEAFMHGYETSKAHVFPEHLDFFTWMIDNQKGKLEDFDVLFEEIKQLFIKNYKPFEK